MEDAGTIPKEEGTKKEEVAVVCEEVEVKRAEREASAVEGSWLNGGI